MFRLAGHYGPIVDWFDPDIDDRLVATAIAHLPKKKGSS